MEAGSSNLSVTKAKESNFVLVVDMSWKPTLAMPYTSVRNR